jgi:iron complex outermembrane receptor protein
MQVAPPRTGLPCILANLVSLLALPVSIAQTGSDRPPPGADAAALAELPLEQLMDLPVRLVSGVSKYEQDVRLAPANVTIFTAADIRNHGWRTLADALRAAPGFHIRDDRFYEYVGNRGFTRSYDYNSRTLILVDGHRISDSIYQQGPVGTDFILDIDTVERIEIIQGPASAVYGSNAFYGAVNVIPKRGRDLAGGQASLTVGSEPSAKGRVSLGDRTADGVEYTLSATAWNSDGERRFDLPQAWRDEDPALTEREAKNQDQLAVANAFANISWRGLEAEAAYSRRRKDALPPVYFTKVGDSAYGVDERAYALLRAEGDPSPDSNLGVRLAVDYYHYEGFFSPAFASFERLAPYATSLSLGSELRWRANLSERHTLVAGVEFQENLRQVLRRKNLTTGASAIPAVPNETSRHISPFAQFDWDLSESLRLSTGARYDYYDSKQERATPRIGLIWDADASTTLKLIYGESFRVPNLSERFAAELTFVPNPDLAPEICRTTELIFQKKLGPVWSVDGQLYHISSEGLIGADPVALTFRNLETFVTEGVGLGANAYFPSGLQLRASGTLQRTKNDDTGANVSDAPRTLLKLLGSAPLGRPWLRGSVEILHVGERKDPRGGQVDGYATANLTLHAAQIYRRWNVSLSFHNVTGSRWTDPTDEIQIKSPPRTVVLKTTLDF